MPVYDYLCPTCGPITALRPMAAHAEPIACPDCGGTAPRALLQAPHLSSLSSERRTAFERNEAARQAPALSTKASREEKAREKKAARHPAGCACCSGIGSRRSGTVFTADGGKAFPAKRPWMISH